MGEYAPITKELREYIRDNTPRNGNCWWQPEDTKAVIACCDSIDAIHRLLEAENERLREELDRVLSEQDDAAPEKPRTSGAYLCELTVTSHLDFEALARDLEEAARAVRSIGGDGE